MTTPTKPWEGAGVNFRSDISPLSIQSSSKVPEVNVRTMSSAPPPLPPRPTSVAIRRTTSNSGIVGGSQIYRGYPPSGGYVSGYGGYGGYGNFGMYGGGYGGYGPNYTGYPYGYQNGNDNRLVALAEERTRPAFESIESVVRAFGSVSFMLESTLGALHASFRAALGVADHLSHLRNILSALSIFRLLQWCIRQLRRLLGMRNRDSAFGGVWGEAANVGEQVGAASSPPSSPSQWPLQAFIGVVISGSYLAWRLLSYIVGSGGTENLSPFKGEEGELWVQAKDPACQLAISCYNFTATLEQELSFSAGDRLIIAPKTRQPVDCREWLLAVHLRTARQPQQNPLPPIKVGLVPANYVRIVERRPRQVPYQMSNIAAQPQVMPVAAQPPSIPHPGRPLPPPTVTYGQHIVPAPPPPTAIPICNPTDPAHPPILVEPITVELPVAQPISDASSGLDAAAATQTMESESRDAGSELKPGDGGQGA